MAERLPKLVFPGLNLDSRAGHPGCVAAIAAAIDDAAGRVPFARFMELALYHPEHGYYRRASPVGRGGDFLTSPEVHPAFAAAIACQIQEIWEALGRPSVFQVVEAGGGTGKLAESILDWLREAFPTTADATLYSVFDPAPISGDSGHADVVRTRGADLSDLAAPIHGVILSNELLDAMPVHRLRWQDGQWHELWVTRAGQDFEMTPGPVSDESLLSSVADVEAAPGQVVEVGRAAEAWMAGAAEQLEAGLILTFDYGDLAPGIYGPARMDGTLRCFADHGLNHDPFRAIGKQDITASVNFSAVEARGRAAGLGTAGFTTQAAFLGRWGVDEILADLRGAEFQSDAVVADRQALRWLTRPDGLGGVKVLAQARGVAPFHLTGFEGPGPAPRLTPERWPRLPVHDPFAALR